jgi:NTP pyrophosphatase (non-canonical NTP hydrolase)
MELLPCPFCGSTNLHVYLNAPSSDTKPWEHVACLFCGAGQSSKEKWNRRSNMVANNTKLEMERKENMSSTEYSSYGQEWETEMRQHTKIELIYLLKESYQKEPRRQKILQAAIEKFGPAHQIGIAAEECSELIQALSKYRRYGTIYGVREEIADCRIMLDQMEIIFAPGQGETIEQIEQMKLERLQKLTIL